MSPEMLGKKKYDTKTDVWSFASTAQLGRLQAECQAGWVLQVTGACFEKKFWILMGPNPSYNPIIKPTKTVCLRSPQTKRSSVVPASYSRQARSCAMERLLTCALRDARARSKILCACRRYKSEGGHGKGGVRRLYTCALTISS